MLSYVVIGCMLLMGSGNLQTSAAQATVASVSKRADAGLTESEKVERLIMYVRSMKDATFIRNGSAHSCQQAADHLQSKWEKHKSKVGSAREFIEELASKSGMSGEPYKIKFKDGTESTCNALLTQELKRLENL